MNRNIPISKIIHITVYVLLFFIIIFVFTGIWLNFYFNKKIIENIQKQVTESTKDEYVLSLDGLSINLFTHTITVNNLLIAPSKKYGIHLKAEYIFRAKVLRIVDFSIFSYLMEKDLLVDRLEFEEPQISIFQGYERLPKKKMNSASSSFSLYTLFSKKLNSILINHIEIVNSKFNIYKNDNDTFSFFSTNDNSISINNFNVNAETDKKNRLFEAEKFEMVMNKFSYHPGNGLYTLYGKSLHASYLDSILIVDSLQLVPNFSKKEFADEAGRQVSRAKVIFSEVICKKMDVKLFFEYNWLVIHKVDIAGCAIDVFRDNTLPLAPINRPSLQVMVKSLPFFVAVDSIELENGTVNFEVLNPGTSSTGKISVNRLNIIITGVQNDTTTYLGDENIEVQANGYLLNQGRFTETYKFPLKATKEFFYCSGSIKAMDMKSFNPIIEQAKHLSIQRGRLDHVSFSFVAHENSSKGTMRFMYHDLKVELLNKEDKKNKLKTKLKTFLVNKLMVQESNPGKDGIVRVSTIYVKHNPYRYFLNYSMQSVLSGIEPAIKSEKGVKMQQERK